MNDQMPNVLGGYPGKNYLDYQALEDIALSELEFMSPRVQAEVTINGRIINSLEDLEDMEAPFEFQVRFPKALRPTSELFDAVKSSFETDFTSEDDVAVINEHMSNPEAAEENLSSMDYQGLIANTADFVTTLIRLWQTNHRTRKMIPGASETITNLRVAAIDSIRFSDEDGDMNYFDANKVEDLMASDNPYISDNDMENLYAETPEGSPKGIAVLHINGLVEGWMQYVYGYAVPQEVITPKQIWESEGFNNIRFKVNNKQLFRILVAYMLGGAPHIFHTDKDYVL